MKKARNDTASLFQRNLQIFVAKRKLADLKLEKENFLLAEKRSSAAIILLQRQFRGFLAIKKFKIKKKLKTRAVIKIQSVVRMF